MAVGRYLRSLTPLLIVTVASLGGVVALAATNGGAAAAGPTDEPEAAASADRSTPAQKEEAEVRTETATCAAGCFWGVELRFSNVEGVLETSVGYIGGTKDDPTYKEVCYTDTGHAEAVRVVFDPEVVTYDELLDVFWRCHDPTQVNRQGPDVGTQYRSEVFVHSAEQREAAEASRAALQRSDAFRNRFGDREVATRITDAPTFWEAEDYHQDYLRKRGQETCHAGW